MKKFIAIALLNLFLSSTSHAQLTRGNWMVGGQLRIESQAEVLNTSNVKTFLVQIAPDVGYFFADKVAAGLNPSFNYSKTRINTVIGKAVLYGIGPFIRYYLLPSENVWNILTGMRYQYVTNFDDYDQNKLTISAGPVVYFNSSVGLEFTANYDRFQGGTATSANTFYLAVGFQIHLKKLK